MPDALTSAAPRGARRGRPLVVASSPDVTRGLALGRRGDDVEAQLLPTLPDPAALDPDRPTVVLLDRRFVASVAEPLERLRALARVAALVWCGAPGEAAPHPDVPVELLASFVPGGAPPATMAVLLRGAMRHAVALRAERLARREADDRVRELAELAQVGAALGTERDLLILLELILSQARRLTASDAGSLYLMEQAAEHGHEDAAPRLRFKLSQNHSRPELVFEEFTIAVDHTSLAGYAAAADTVLAIPDVYRVAEDVAYRQNRSFDERFGYRTRSVLVIPLKTTTGDIVGVLQLINRKRTATATLHGPDDLEREVLPYDRRSIELVAALAAQAAVAIENSRLYESIERLFESFVSASVSAIESRDPATSGHSARVAGLTVGLAELLDQHGQGSWRGTRFSRDQLRELRYAALLHDFGKVGVREEVLVKGKKLYAADLERIRARLQRVLLAEDVAYERARADHLLAHGRDGYEARVAELAARRDERQGHVQRLLRAVLTANEPTVLPAGSFEELERLGGTAFPTQAGEPRPLLQEGELRALRVRQGTLDERERREIQAHVTHTYRFLSQIPWTPELRNVPEFAYGHHEKLNGLGYPRGLRAAQLPVQVRIMTIADIFDALTATDRPYKRAVPVERALDIMRREVDAGELDRELFATFVESGLWKASDE